ncbi:hypothetical protein ACLIMP_15825 [Novosphingobium aerophilum]|uniref:hypothetical protein n=1 Tax=Novosphingobium TaxID=165696 RepID=UPI002D7794CC|nr:hypothetical protein [Novosphingobium sp. RL4]WRT92705.1 hypothetical protein U9J33_16150 [Novosphingobium sp. RL4]
MKRILALIAALAAAQAPAGNPQRPSRLEAGPEAQPGARLASEIRAPLPPMRLGAASNFSQGNLPRLFNAALALPLANWRDSIRWADVEKTRGRYTFDQPMSLYPASLEQHHARMTLTLNWGNPLYDAGQTPHSPEALAAFGKFVAEVVRRYPAIDTLEIGNEINGNNFVSGPMKDAPPAQRLAYHLAMVRSAAKAARAVRPDIKVIGGSTHSLPGGFLWPLLDQGGAGLLDGLALHPYTTPIDQLPAQVAVLRRHPSLAPIPLYMTEYGSLDPEHAGDDLVRAYATLSSLGIAEFDWYPLNDRGDGFVPLLRRDARLTEAGRAFRFVTKQLGDHRGEDRSPDRFTFIHAFGARTWVLWGAARPISIDSASVSAFDAAGTRLSGASLMLAEDRVLILTGKVPLKIDEHVKLGCTPLIADSFLGFTFPAPDGAIPSQTVGLVPFWKTGSREAPFMTFPGQQTAGVPWTPYLAPRGAAVPRVAADTIVPATGANGDAVLLRYTARSRMVLRIEAEFALTGRSESGLAVSMRSGGQSVFATRGAAPIRIERTIPLAPGQTLDFVVAPEGAGHTGPVRYRIRLYDTGACAPVGAIK